MGIAPPLRSARRQWAGGTLHRSGDAMHMVSWTDAERAVVERWAEKLEAEGLVSELVYLPALLVDNSSQASGQNLLDQLRAAARRADVDAVLVTHSLSDVRTSVNLWALLDLTIVGAFVFPGHTGTAVTVSEAVLFDVTTNQLYAFADGQGEADMARAFVNFDHAELSDEARVASLDNLGSALFDHLVARRRR